MKKALLLLLILMIPVFGIFAKNYLTTSFGVAFFNATETVTYEGVTASANEKSSCMSLDLSSSWFGDSSRVGFNLGMTILYPLSKSIDGVEYTTRFLNCNWCPKLGVSMKYEVSDKFCSISSIGYEMMFNFASEYSSELGATISSTVFVHGLYATESFIYTVDSNMSFNFGLSMYVPLFGSQKLSAPGYGSETYRGTYSGMMINPQVGFNINYR